MKKISLLMVGAAAVIISLSCNKKETGSSSPGDSDTVVQQAGDVMASIDESGGSNGTYSMLSGEQKMFARLAPGLAKDRSLASLLLPKANAGSCLSSSTWGSCLSNVIVRNFNNCTLGSATFDGTVTLTFNDGNLNNICTVDSDGDNIVRVPNFTITGPRGGQYSVTKTATVGQKVTRVSNGNFTFSSDGIRRTVSYQGTTLADYTTSTTSDLGITGTSRNGRVLNGGTLHVVNNITAESCDLTPSNVTWTNTCNCPTSGSWSASCSGGGTGTLTITGCGAGTSTIGGTSQDVIFDRCLGI